MHWPVRLALLHFAFCIFNSAAQTPVLFPLAEMTGNTNDTTLTIRPVVNPIQFHSTVCWLPTAGIQLRTLNGSATTNLIPNDYNVTIAGVPGSWKISVSDTNITLNAALIGNLTTYSFTNPAPGVIKLIAGSNISLTPPLGQGVVTINATGAGGSASNAFQLQAGNNLIGLSTNPGALLYTISGVSQTNGYPWGVLYDPAGAARAATNGYPWGTLYDPLGSATAATNGLGLAGGLAAFRGTNTFASTNPATASTPGLVKVDNATITVSSDGTISATTGGGGTVTSVGLAMPGEFSVTGSPVTGSGTLAVTRAGNANFLNFGATNLSFLALDQWQLATNASHSLLLSNALYHFAPFLLFTNGALNIGGAMTNNAGYFGNGGGLTNIQGSNISGVLPINTIQTNQYAYFDGPGGATNVSSTLDGKWWTNIAGANLVLDTAVLSPASNGTNYTATLRPGATGMQTIYGANANINLSLAGTNNADWERTVFVNNFTGAVNCNLTFTFPAATNANFSAVISNGCGAMFNFWNADTTGANVLVSDAGRYHH